MDFKASENVPNDAVMTDVTTELETGAAAGDEKAVTMKTSDTGSDALIAAKAGEALVREGEPRRGVFTVTKGALRRIRLLMAVRIGESWPPQLARQIATIDRILGGRLTVNIISSDLPGETLASAPRYARTLEAMQILNVKKGRPADYSASDEMFQRLRKQWVLDNPNMSKKQRREMAAGIPGLEHIASSASKPRKASIVKKKAKPQKPRSWR